LFYFFGWAVYKAQLTQLTFKPSYLLCQNDGFKK